MNSKSPKVPEIDAAYRDATTALEKIVGKRRALWLDLAEHDVSDLIRMLPALVEEAAMTAAGAVGPNMQWLMKPARKSFRLITAVLDMEGGRRGFGVTAEYELDNWYDGGALYQAARAYRRECGWDFTPDKGDLWVIMLAPLSHWGADSETGRCDYEGHLVGFAILRRVLLSDDDDNDRLAVAHLWVASAWRRGIAVRLLAEAKRRYGYTSIDGPLTDASRALLLAHPGLVPATQTDLVAYLDRQRAGAA